MSSPVRPRPARRRSAAPHKGHEPQAASSRPVASLPLPAHPSKPIATRKMTKPVSVATPGALVHELGSCVTEADIVQVLYRGLEPIFGYDVVLLQVLEREGWYHS